MEWLNFKVHGSAPDGGYCQLLKVTFEMLPSRVRVPVAISNQSD